MGTAQMQRLLQHQHQDVGFGAARGLVLDAAAGGPLPGDLLEKRRLLLLQHQQLQQLLRGLGRPQGERRTLSLASPGDSSSSNSNSRRARQQQMARQQQHLLGASLASSFVMEKQQ